MNPNAQASRQRIAGMLARFLGNSAVFECSPAKAALPGAEDPSVCCPPAKGSSPKQGLRWEHATPVVRLWPELRIRFVGSPPANYLSPKMTASTTKFPQQKELPDILKHQDTGNSFLLFRYIFQAFLQAFLLHGSRLIFLRLGHLF
jgi:hypothetical protein